MNNHLLSQHKGRLVWEVGGGDRHCPERGEEVPSFDERSTGEHYSCAPVDGLVLNQANEPIASVEQTVFEEMGTSRDGHSPN